MRAWSRPASTSRRRAFTADRGRESPPPSPPGGLGRRTPCPGLGQLGGDPLPSPAGCGRAGGRPRAVTVWAAGVPGGEGDRFPSCPRAEGHRHGPVLPPGIKPFGLGEEVGRVPGPLGPGAEHGRALPVQSTLGEPLAGEGGPAGPSPFGVGSRCPEGGGGVDGVTTESTYSGRFIRPSIFRQATPISSSWPRWPARERSFRRGWEVCRSPGQR